MRRFIVPLALSCGLAALAPAADAASNRTVRFTLTTDMASSHVWRGMELNDEIVFQPALSMDFGGWNFGASGVVDLEDDAAGKSTQDFQRVEYTASYTREIGRVRLGGGLTHHAFPGTGMEDTSEAFVKIAVRAPAEFRALIVHDLDEARGEYVNASVGHLFMTGAHTGLDLRGGLGWGDRDFHGAWYGLRENGVSDMTAELRLIHQLGEAISLHGFTKYSVVMEDHLRDALSDGDHLVAGFGADIKF